MFSRLAADVAVAVNVALSLVSYNIFTHFVTSPMLLLSPGYAYNTVYGRCVFTLDRTDCRGSFVVQGWDGTHATTATVAFRAFALRCTWCHILFSRLDADVVVMVVGMSPVWWAVSAFCFPRRDRSPWLFLRSSAGVLECFSMGAIYNTQLCERRELRSFSVRVPRQIASAGDCPVSWLALLVGGVNVGWVSGWIGGLFVGLAHGGRRVL